MLLICCGVLLLFLFFLFLDARTKRHDGIHLKQSHPYRKLMPFVMRTRNESLVYFDLDIPAAPLLEFLKKNHDFGMTQCVVGALAQTLQKNPSANRFISGKRLYQRKKIVISFSMKREKLGTKSKIAVVRQTIDPEDRFRDICQKIASHIQRERSDTKTYADKEYNLLTSLPRFALRIGVWFVQTLDEYNLLPASFIENDGMYCSVFVANLGSLRMRPGYHHLYEWGNCPIFITVGSIEERIVAQQGQAIAQSSLPIRGAFDERINDGLGMRDAIETLKTILSDPQHYLQPSSSDF